jgi:hypothetical protein
LDFDLFERIGKISWTIPVLIWFYILYFEANFLNIAVLIVTTLFVSLWYINKRLQFSVGLNTRFLYIILCKVILDILYIYSLIRIYKYANYWEAHSLFWIHPWFFSPYSLYQFPFSKFHTKRKLVVGK